CIADVRSWFIGNRLMINDAKTDFLIIGTRQQPEKTSVEFIIIGDTVIKSLESLYSSFVCTISSVRSKTQLLYTWGSGLCSCCTCFIELAAINYKNK
ncbi:unnamed protein product, partial [Porites lobata]